MPPLSKVQKMKCGELQRTHVVKTVAPFNVSNFFCKYSEKKTLLLFNEYLISSMFIINICPEIDLAAFLAALAGGSTSIHQKIAWQQP